MEVRLSALRAGRHLPPGRYMILISVRGWIDSRATVRNEGLGNILKMLKIVSEKLLPENVYWRCLIRNLVKIWKEVIWRNA
jgi:hypothetical protein